MINRANRGEFCGMARIFASYRCSGRMISFLYLKKLNRCFRKPVLCVIYNLCSTFTKRLGMQIISIHPWPLEMYVSEREKKVIVLFVLSSVSLQRSSIRLSQVMREIV